MAIAVWSNKFVTGYDEVDKQHQELFRMVNNLHQSILEKKGKEILIKTLDDLANYVVVHFKTEEVLMQKKGYPSLVEHKLIHDKLTKDAIEIIDGYKSGKLVLSITLSKFLGDWIQNHIEIEDMKMINYVKTH